jgi:hypothetical protein
VIYHFRIKSLLENKETVYCGQIKSLDFYHFIETSIVF